MRPPLVIAVSAVALMAGCTSDDDDAATSTSPATAAQSTAAQSTASTSPVQSAAARTTEGAQFAVESLGLTFRLPESFVAVDDADYAFFARSMSPRSLFTISEDSPEVTDHDAEPGESLSELDLRTADAVVVTGAVLEGMPAGVSANELLVSNGEQSFSVIMSSATSNLSEFWDVFINSVAVTPAD